MDILSSKSKKFIKKINDAPKKPGCYIYMDSKGKPLYVGKAKNVFNRVRSYFSNFTRLDLAKKQMIEQAKGIEFFTVDSEVEALILENNLIKKYKPKYNISMRDDKNYIFVRFEKVRRSNQPIPKAMSSYQDYPRITIVREKKEDGAEYFGPYPSAMPAKRILKRLRKIFPYRSTKHLVYQISEKPFKTHTESKKPCFYYHIGLCNGACAGLEKKKDYVRNYKSIRSFFTGEKNKIINKLERKMLKASKKSKFEEAARIRDRINDIKYVAANLHVDNSVDDVVVDSIRTNIKEKGLDQLVEKLEFPTDKIENHKNFRIECYDISNIQGTNAVGSMVVMVDGEVKPDQYRRFKIRMKNEPNDFAMLQEVLTRRFRQYIFANQKDEELPKGLKTRAKNWKNDESFKQIPDLIIIDGGKGQLASTYKILYSFGLHNEIPIVGLAKKQEEIFKLTDQFKDEYFNQVNDSNQFTKILLPRRSESLYIVQRIRDEAHRFAITYHRKLRSKQMLRD